MLNLCNAHVPVDTKELHQATLSSSFGWSNLKRRIYDDDMGFKVAGHPRHIAASIIFTGQA